MDLIIINHPCCILHMDSIYHITHGCQPILNVQQHIYILFYTCCISYRWCYVLTFVKYNKKN